MTRARALTLALVAVALGLGGWYWHGRDPGRPAPITGPSKRVDLERFRARVAVMRTRAAQLRVRRASAPAVRAPDGATGSRSARGGLSLLSPQCILGPADLCADLAGTVDACDAGDGAACLAVGQYLQDQPPMPLVANLFFHYACKRGEQAGCDRFAQLKAPTSASSPPCADDPSACAWRAYRDKDPALLDEACSLGVADACAWMMQHHEADPARARIYLESACELGNPMACLELARRLSPRCDEDCYPIDRAQAAIAATVACEVGFDKGCALLDE